VVHKIALFRHFDPSTLRRGLGRDKFLKDANGTLIHMVFALDEIFRYKLIAASRPETV
jgi:hypothetical protein